MKSKTCSANSGKQINDFIVSIIGRCEWNCFGKGKDAFEFTNTLFPEDVNEEDGDTFDVAGAKVVHETIVGAVVFKSALNVGSAFAFFYHDKEISVGQRGNNAPKIRIT